MIGSIVAVNSELMLKLDQFYTKYPNLDINTKERYPCDVYAECPAKLDDNHAYCHHAFNRRFDMD